MDPKELSADQNVKETRETNEEAEMSFVGDSDVETSFVSVNDGDESKDEQATMTEDDSESEIEAWNDAIAKKIAMKIAIKKNLEILEEKPQDSPISDDDDF